MPPPPPATLMEELIEEILLRLPPEEPASLSRTSLVCKPWCRLISGPRFRRRYRELHRTPPMLGFLCGRAPSSGVQIARFVPTSAFCPPLAERRRRQLVDARHGRVLLLKHRRLVVWDPITDEQREIPIPKLWWLPPSTYTFNAAVVCAARAGTCSHLDCHRGPFLVVFVVSVPGDMLIWTYSSDTGSWSGPIFGLKYENVIFQDLLDPSMLVGNALYFGAQTGIVRYDLGSHKMSAVGLPPAPFLDQPSRHPFVLTSPEDGRLGLATIHESKLYMWSTKHGPEADGVWTCDSVIELETLLYSNAILAKPVLVGLVDRIGVSFLRADDLLFTVDLNTRKVKKVHKGRGIHTVVPYMSFCTPALGGGLRGEGPSAGVSSA